MRQSRLLDSSGGISSPERALSVGAVYSCVRTISMTVGSVSLLAYQQQRDGERDRAQDSDLWTLVHDRAHPHLPASRMWQVAAAHMAGWGSAYLLKVREGNRVVALWPLYPSRVTVCEEGGEVYFDHRTPDGVVHRLTSREVLHIPYFCIDGVTGISPLEMVRRELGAIDGETTFREALLQNGARLSGVLTTQNELSPDAATRIAAQWAAMKQGANNAGAVAVLEGGMQWLPMSAAPRDLEFVEQRKASVADVARWFGVPPSLVNAPANDSLTYSTSEGEATGFLKWCLLPGYFTPIESAVNSDPDLTPQGSGLKVEFLTQSLLRADSKTRAEVYEIESRIGSITRDEIRRAENRPPLPAGTPAPAQGALPPQQ